MWEKYLKINKPVGWNKHVSRWEKFLKINKRVGPNKLMLVRLLPPNLIIGHLGLGLDLKLHNRHILP